MKQRGKRSNSKLVHVSFDEVERFVPRVPKQICPDEDNTTPRICVAPNILSAIQAMPQGGTVAYNMARLSGKSGGKSMGRREESANECLLRI